MLYSLPFCCVVVVALPFSAFLGVIVHTCIIMCIEHCLDKERSSKETEYRKEFYIHIYTQTQTHTHTYMHTRQLQQLRKIYFYLFTNFSFNSLENNNSFNSSEKYRCTCVAVHTVYVWLGYKVYVAVVLPTSNMDGKQEANT